LEQLAEDVPHHYFARLGLLIKYALDGQKEKVLQLLCDDFIATSRRDVHYSWRMATGYALIDEKEDAIDWIENAVNRGFINYPFLAGYDPLLESIRGEVRFKALLERVRHEWEHFEV
jgi:non-specific serine/threonine protein kinase